MLALYTRLDSSKRLKDYFKVNVIQGLIAIKGLRAKGFFRNLRIRAREWEKKTLLLRAPLVAISAVLKTTVNLHEFKDS